MFVVTADQIDSRHRADLADGTMSAVTAVLGEQLVLPMDRTAGDEIQLIVESGKAALTAILLLTRAGDWSVGCGSGSISLPLGATTRETTGPAFFAARDAVDAAKKRETRFAFRDDIDDTPSAVAAEDTEALIDLLLQSRARRSPEGWELYDLMAGGMTQAAAASTLGITPQAASKRARVAAIRAEFRAVAALCRVLALRETTAVQGSTA